MKWFNLLCLILAVFWTALLANGFKSLPAVGRMLSIKNGVWSHQAVDLRDLRLEGLKKPVSVIFDGAGVPHFFAENESDLFMVQGFVMASQRLFQMDLITRITAGRLSELFGERTLKTDEFFVKFGMRESARKSLAKFNEDPRTANLLNAFAAGVNSFIKSGAPLSPEYVILGLAPELWDVSRVVHMGKQLTFGLAGRSYDHYLTRIQQQLGTAKVLDLFPEFTDLDDIVYPSKSKVARRLENENDFKFTSFLQNVPFFPLPAAGNGSNNWAVSGKKSTTGMSIMANDTHLGHTLPNVWYESQLSVPDYNVYGVGLVAIPGIVNGFNSKVSWGPTNGTTDVLDYFEVEFESRTSNFYKFGEAKLESEVQREKIEVRDREPETVDVLWTKFGVILHREEKLGLAAKWVGHNSGNELKAIHSLFTSQNVDDCLKAFEPWAVPVQNFVCADRYDIALKPMGFMPKRKIGDGRFIMEGNERANLLEDPIPESEKPQMIRPSSGFTLSANARQSDRYYPYYLGWDFEDPFRGMMIRRRLTEKEKFSPEDMIQIQNDMYDPQAELALPLMLQALEGLEIRGTEESKALEELKTWDKNDRASLRAPAVFKEWFEQLKFALFDDDFKTQSTNFYPKDARTIQLLRNVLKNPQHPDASWVDNKHTPEKENLRQVVANAFFLAWAKLTKDQGRKADEWTFKNWVRTRVPHVARFPGFGVDLLTMDGGGESIRGNQGNHGAVYKIVVANGDWPRAWIQVPGGNAGDPFTREYERNIKEWAAGEMRPVEFYHNLEEAKLKSHKTVVFSP